MSGQVRSDADYARATDNGFRRGAQTERRGVTGPVRGVAWRRVRIGC